MSQIHARARPVRRREPLKASIVMRLPAIDGLYMFAVAARHLNFTKAAAALHRTQSAVSHRMRALEAQIGVRLFRRGPRGLELTAAGETLAHQVDRAISDLTRTIGGLRRGSETRKLRITTLPSVASRWLLPRLPRFCEQHPDIEVQVIAEPRTLDLRAEAIQLAIRFGHGHYRGHTATPLMEERVVPVCSPRLIARRPRIATIDALLALPLLHDSGAEGDDSLSDWHSWLDQLGRSDLPYHAGQRFSDAGLTIEAAVLGLGVALARLSLVADHLASGNLVCPLPMTTPTAFAYYLVALPGSVNLPEVVLFSEWLRAEARATESLAAQIQAENGARRSGRSPAARATGATGSAAHKT
jgi:LysR family glycine cleavage system transcriptional activator